MLETASNLDALFISFSKIFTDSLNQYPQPLLDAVGSRISSNTRDQRYPIVQTLSGVFREWLGERRINNIVVDGFVVTNKRWENSLAIDKLDIQFDQYGVYRDMLIPMLARNARLLPDQQIAAAITANSTGYDGVAMFSASHPVDPSGGSTSNTQSNALTSVPLNSTNLAKVQAAMMSFLGPDNKPLGSYGDTLFVPPSLKYVADTLANAAFYPEAKNNVSGVFGAQSNIFQGAFKVVASPYLADTSDPTTAIWYLIDGRDPKLRPWFWQEVEAPTITALTDPGNSLVFMNDKYYMGGRAVGAASSALWFKAIKCSP